MTSDPASAAGSALPRDVLDPPGPGRALPRLAEVEASPLRLSPYPLAYTLRWPWYCRWPSTRNHAAIEPLPLRARRADAAPQRTVRLCAVGDILVMLRDRVPVFDPALRALFATADLIVGTCEAAIARPDCDPRAAYRFVFNMPAAFLREIIARSDAPAERWCLSVANNHAGDVGPESLASTVRHLRALGVHPIGARIAGEPPVTVIERGGLRLGLAAWTHWLNLPAPQAWRTAEVLALAWPALRAAHRLDGLIGSAHWEYEWQHFPRRETCAVARQLAAAGFDLVIGAHPHVLQPMAWIDRALCAYSLGNFCGELAGGWTGRFPPASRLCSVLTVELGTEGAHRGQVIGYELHLFAQVDDGERVALRPLAAAPEPLRRQIARGLDLVVAR